MGSRPLPDAASANSHGAGGRICVEPHGTGRGQIRFGLAGPCNCSSSEAQHLDCARNPNCRASSVVDPEIPRDPEDKREWSQGRTWKPTAIQLGKSKVPGDVPENLRANGETVR